MKQHLFAFSLFIALHSFCMAQQTALPSAQKHNAGADRCKTYYIGTNPISVIAAFQLQDNIKRYIPEVSGLEYGFSLTGGYFTGPKHMLETRFAAGNIHQISRVVQLHAGLNYFLFTHSGKWSDDFYIGGFIKFWDYYNRLTKIHFYNIAPYLTFGYVFDLNRVLVDVRMNQTVAVYSWSSLIHSSAGMDWFFSPWPEFLPIMPSLTVSLAWRF